MSFDATIMGAGVAGLAMAAELSGRGAKIQVIDPYEQPGAHACSWWAGGMLAPYCEGVLTEPEVVKNGVRAIDWWEKQGAQVTRNGSLVVALKRDQSELKTFERRAQNAVRIDAARVAELEPDLKGQFQSALLIKQEAHIDPRKTLTELRARLNKRQVRFTKAADAEGQIIDCRGMAAADDLPKLRGVKGEMVVIKTHDVTLTRPVRLLHARHPLYIVPRGDGVFMLGATQIESGDRNRASVRSVLELLTAAYALHPAFGEAELLEIGVDARPAFPDNQPRIRHRKDRIFVNGLFRHGFLLAPSLAMMSADLILEGKTPEDWYEDHR